MTRHHHLRFAGSAIAAALALATTPAFAQDAEAPGSPPITIVVPQPSAAPAPAPAAAPAAQIEAPVIAAPQDDLRAAAPSLRAPAERAVPRTRSAVAPAERSAPVAAASATSSQAAADAAPATAAPAVEAAPIAGPQTNATADNGSGDEMLLGAGLLAALGLGGLALASRRRRRAGRVAADASPDPVVVTPREQAPAPMAYRAPPQWTSPAAFAIPAVVPKDMQARRELIERMVTAKPDAENPFKSRKARTRRARLILADRIANQRPVFEDRVVARPAAAVETNPQREFEQA